jgi:hypothetical protein
MPMPLRASEKKKGTHTSRVAVFMLGLDTNRMCHLTVYSPKAVGSSAVAILSAYSSTPPSKTPVVDNPHISDTFKRAVVDILDREQRRGNEMDRVRWEVTRNRILKALKSAQDRPAT